MNEMVERAARALATALHRDPDATLGSGEPTWRAYVGPAESVIAAMRTPTGAMIDEGWQLTGDPCWKEDLACAWTRMIDEALAD